MRRRLTSTDGILLLTVVLWALNIIVTKYILDNGFQPLAYAAMRYGARDRDLPRADVRARATRCASAAERSLARWAIAAFALLPQPGVLRLRAQAHDGDDGGAHPRHDAGVRRALRVAGRARAHDRGGSGSPRASPSAASRLVAAGSGGDFSGELAGILVARRHRRHVGGLLGRHRAAHADVLAVSHQLGRARRSCGCRSSSSRAPRSPIRTSTSAGSSGSASRSPSSGRSLLTNVLWFTAVHRVGPATGVALREPPAVPRGRLRRDPPLGAALRLADRRRPAHRRRHLPRRQPRDGRGARGVRSRA